MRGGEGDELVGTAEDVYCCLRFLECILPGRTEVRVEGQVCRLGALLAEVKLGCHSPTRIVPSTVTAQAA